MLSNLNKVNIRKTQHITKFTTQKEKCSNKKWSYAYI